MQIKQKFRVVFGPTADETSESSRKIGEKKNTEEVILSDFVSVFGDKGSQCYLALSRACGHK